jgi:glucose-1-phosphate cytidylyltransferase
MLQNQMKIHQSASEDWRVTLVDTGDHSGTGGRLRKVREFIGDDDFCFTYGDGVSNVNIRELVSFHKTTKKLATVTTIQPPHRFGAFHFEGDQISGFKEKPAEGGWINGGYFVLSPKVIDFIEHDEMMWEHAPLEKLVEMNELCAFKHKGFWYAMDTLRDKNYLNDLWIKGRAPWKIW